MEARGVAIFGATRGTGLEIARLLVAAGRPVTGIVRASSNVEALQSAGAKTITADIFSAGDVEEGKRRYVVRTEGELNTVEAVREVVVRSDEDATSGRLARVRVGDIAEVSFGYREPTASIRMLSEGALAMRALRDSSSPTCTSTLSRPE